MVVAAGARIASGIMARVVSFFGIKGEEGVEFSDFIVVLFTTFEAAAYSMEARPDVSPSKGELSSS